MESSPLAQALNERLRQMGARPRDLADALGVRDSTVSKYLSGQIVRPRDPVVIRRMAAFLAMSENEFRDRFLEHLPSDVEIEALVERSMRDLVYRLGGKVRQAAYAHIRSVIRRELFDHYGKQCDEQAGPLGEWEEQP